VGGLFYSLAAAPEMWGVKCPADRFSFANTPLKWCGCRARNAHALGQNLIARFGPDIRLPDLREEIVPCERHGKMHDACMVRYVDLISKR
jgi:hypothetical protein